MNPIVTQRPHAFLKKEATLLDLAGWRNVSPLFMYVIKIAFKMRL